MRSSWYLLRSAPLSAAENMAVDDALLENCGGWGRTVLRFYGWREAGATFGYSQRFAEVERLTRLRPLVRRLTGGGLVPHAGDWTYSLVAPPCDPWYKLKAVESYRRIHEWLAAAFARLGVTTELAPVAQPGGHGQCFVGSERFDLLCQQEKLAGAAQRRTRQGLLIQGSVQPPPVGLAKADWQEAVVEVARGRWGIDWLGLELSPALQKRVQILAREKYSSPGHNQRR